MKKLLILVALIMALTLVFVACSDDTEKETTTGTVAKTDPATDPATNPATTPDSDPATTPATDPATTPATDPATTPATDPATETDPVTETDPATETETETAAATETETATTPAETKPAVEVEDISNVGGMSPDTYYENGEQLNDGGSHTWLEANRPDGISGVQSAGFRGWAYVEGETVVSYGYVLDDGTAKDAIWNDSFVQDGSDVNGVLGRSDVTRYTITINLAEIPTGEHTLHLLVKTEEGTVAELSVWGTLKVTGNKVDIIDTEDIDAEFLHVSKDEIWVKTEGTTATLKAWGWVALTADLDSYGYKLDNNAPVFDDAWVYANTEQAVYDVIEGLGGTAGCRFDINATVTDLAYGEHTVQFLYRLENGTVVCFETKTFEVQEVVETKPAIDKNGNANLSNVTGGTYGPFDAAGYSEDIAKLGYNGLISLGTVDLSKYTKVTIWYGCDGGDGTKAHFEALNGDAPIGLKSTATSYGQVGEYNMEGDIAHADMVFGGNWAAGQRSVEIDLSEITYNGEVWVTIHNPEGTEIVISSVVFEGSSSSVEHDYADGLSAWYDGKNNEGNTWKDLIGGNDMTLTTDDNNKFTENGFALNSTKQYFPQEIVDLINGEKFTVEILFGDFTGIGENFNTIMNSENDHFALFRRVSNNVLEYKWAGNGGNDPRPKVDNASDILPNSLITITYEVGGKVAVYVNGKLASEVDCTATMTADNLFIGQTGKKAFSALFKSIRFYDRALTAEEVLANAVVDGVAEGEQETETETEPETLEPIDADVKDITAAGGMSPDTYYENGAQLNDGASHTWLETNRPNGLSGVDSVGFRGWSYVTGETVLAYGYVLDDGTSKDAIWNESFVQDGSDVNGVLGRTDVTRYTITINLADIPEGEHTLHLLVRTKEGTVAELTVWGTLKVTGTKVVETEAPTEPATEPSYVIDFADATDLDAEYGFNEKVGNNVSYELNADGYVTFTAPKSDPYVWIRGTAVSGLYDIPASKLGYVVIKYRTNYDAPTTEGNENLGILVYIKTTDGTTESKTWASASTAAINDNEWHVAIIDGSAAWGATDDKLSIFRLDPLEASKGDGIIDKKCDIAYIYFFETKEAAEAFAAAENEALEPVEVPESFKGTWYGTDGWGWDSYEVTITEDGAEVLVSDDEEGAYIFDSIDAYEDGKLSLSGMLGTIVLYFNEDGGLTMKIGQIEIELSDKEPSDTPVGGDVEISEDFIGTWNGDKNAPFTGKLTVVITAEGATIVDGEFEAECTLVSCKDGVLTFNDGSDNCTLTLTETGATFDGGFWYGTATLTKEGASAGETVTIIGTDDEKAAYKNSAVDSYGPRDEIIYENSVNLNAAGWVALTVDVVGYGYKLDDNAPVFNDAWTAAAEQAVLDAIKNSGGTYGTRFKISADISDLALGTHTVQFLYKLADGTIVCLKSVTFEVKDASEKPAPKPNVDENGNADISKVTNGTYDYFTAAGYTDKVVNLGYNGTIDLGVIDLSKYSKVSITYACDNGAVTKAKFDALNGDAPIGLKSTATSYGQAGSYNKEGDIAHGQMVYSTEFWAAGARTVEIDLSDISYNGNVYVTVHNPEGTQIVISAVVFTAVKA